MIRRQRLLNIAKVALPLAFLTPFAALALSNLFLLSPPGCTLVAKKLSGIVGMDCSIGGTTWSPWNGITLHNLQIKQPAPLNQSIKQPLLNVSTVRISPNWRKLAHKQLHIRAIDLNQLSIAVPIELLSQLPSPAGSPPIASTPPAIAANTPSQPQTNLQPSQLNPTQQPTPPATNSKPPESKKITLDEKHAPPTVWTKISNSKISIVSTFSDKPIYEITQINGRIPIGGKSATSKIKIGRANSLGHILGENISIHLNSRGSILQTKAIETSFSDISCKMAASIALSGQIPFEFQFAIAEQLNKEIKLSESQSLEIGALNALGGVRGLLKSPSTWQGSLLSKANSIEANLGQHNSTFSDGQILVIFQNATLFCPTARLNGESTSILANGAVLQDGRTAAIVRIVSSPDTLNSLSKFTHPKNTAPNLTELSTPQRSALDLQVFGKPGNFYFLPDPSSKPIPLK